MKNYVSPVIFDNEELAEGVYATGSGGPNGNDGTCWTVEIQNVQKSAGGCSRTHIHGTHSKEVQHKTLSLTVRIDIYCGQGQTVSEVKAQEYGPNVNFEVTNVGYNCYDVTRTYSGNATNSGDDVSFFVEVVSNPLVAGDPNSDFAYVSKVYLPRCQYTANDANGQGADGT